MNASVLLLPGDGIGPEVTSAAASVLAAIGSRFGHSFETSTAAIGGDALKKTGHALPAETLAAARAANAILLGAVGDPAFEKSEPDQRPEAGLLAIRRELGLFANLRPAKVWQGLEDGGPLKPHVLAGTDLLVVRELTGGLYYGEPRGFDDEHSAAINTLRYTRGEIERIARVAFEAARGRRRRVTSIDKANVLEVSRLWRDTVIAVGREYPDVALDHMYVDACAMKLALAPASFDVILTENLFGDILSDEAGAIVGSLGLLPSASLGEGPSLFEPVHGSAPDIAGKGIANPIGAIASVAMLLDHGLGLREEARAVETAIVRTLNAGFRTQDIAVQTKAATTSEMAAAIRDHVLDYRVVAAIRP